MRIKIILDTVCPWCFIGKRRFERALTMHPQENLQIVWQPFQLNPTMPPEGMERKSYLAAKFGGPERAERQNERLRQTGMEEGIEFDFPAIKSTPNTVNSHRLIYFSGLYGRQEAVVEALFRGFFFDGLDLGNPDVLAEIGAPTEKLRVFPGAASWYHPGRSGTLRLGPKNILAAFSS